MDNFKFVNLPFERGEVLFSEGFFYLYGYVCYRHVREEQFGQLKVIRHQPYLTPLIT